MPSTGVAYTADAPLLDQLRAASGSAHAALEAELALLCPPLRRERFIQVLQGFHAFHQAWEPRAEALIANSDLLVPRRRLALLEHDIEALGGESAAPGAAAFDLAYLNDASAAWGSLYVVEGSTLGGQFIAKALRATDWAPPGGLRYFDPHGRRTAAMWAAFRTALEGGSPSLDSSAVVDGACATFAVLQAGFARRRGLAA